MKLRFVTLKWIVFGLIFVSFWHCQKKLELDENTIAIVGSYTIPFKAYQQRYKEYLDVTYQKDNLFLRLGVLRNMINEILLKHYDDNSALEQNTEYQKERVWVKNEILLAYLKETDIYAQIKISDQEAREAFVRVNQRIAARHLYAPTLEEANRLYQLLKQGASFDSLAREVFTDSTLKNNGGFLGYFTWGDMDPAFEDRAYSMKVGDISEPVKTAHGYSIIKVEDRKQVPILTENEYLKKKNQIIRFLKISKRKPAEQAFLHKHFDFEAFAFNEAGVRQLLQLLNPSNNFNQERQTVNYNQQVLRYKSETWNLQTALHKLTAMPDYHLRRIDSIEKLKAALKGLVINEKLLNIVNQKGYINLPEVQHALKNAENNLYLKYKRQEILNRMEVPDSILKKYYRKNLWKFRAPRKLNIREILVTDFATALKIKRQLLDGADFAKLAQQYSLRPETAKYGGETGYVEWGRFGRLKEKFWNAPLGKIIGPLKIEKIYGIFRVEGKEDARPLPFEQIKNEVLEEYKGENQTELIRNYLAKLREKVTIKRNEDLIRSFVLE